MILSRQNKAVLVPFSKVSALYPSAPTLKHNGDTYAVLPHDPRTQIRLRAVGIEVPPPILYHYDWKSADGTVPFQIQKETAALITSNQRSYVLSDMGTGKTKASLWAWRYLYESKVAKKLLIVAPLSTLKFVWQREISLLMPQYKSVVLHGLKSKRLELLNSDAKIFIINHDGLRTIANELHARTDIDCLILDELAVYRNNSLRSKVMREFSKRFVFVWGLTGRPMPTSPTDVWGQAKIITPQRVPKYFRHAQSMLMHQISQYKWVPKANAIETAYTWLQPAVRYSLEDVVELPEFISRTIEVDMTDEQIDAYRELSNEFAAIINEQTIDVANAAVLLGKLLQTAAGYIYTENPQYVVLDSKPRQDMLLEIIDEADHKLIVFAPWKHLIENLSALFTENEIDHAVVHGEITKREEIFNDFQNTPRYKVLLAHPQTVHHGLTLTAATTTVWYSPVLSLEVYEQAQARIRRIGQHRKQLFLHLCASPVEQEVYGMLRRKQRLQDLFLAMMKTTTGKANGKAGKRKDG